ncbi:ATP-binding cassette domain-containing protein [bacterium]|nr:ATP-binding cassette domain-containing protein [bacterium]
MSEKEILIVNSLSIEIDNRKLFSNISFKLKQGETLGIQGFSGSGKTSLLLALAGFKQPSLSINGEIIRNFSFKEISLMFQNPLYQLLGKNPFEEFFFSFAKTEDIPTKDDIENFAKKHNIFDILYKDSNKLSGGEGQKIAFLSTIISKSKIMILDEPTQYSDYSGIKKIEEFIKNRGDLTVIIADHNLEFLRDVSDKMVVIESSEKLDNLNNNQQNNKIHINNKRNNILNNLEKKLLIDIENISFSYKNRELFKNFSFKIFENDLVLLKGLNGVGKTTLFTLIMGIYKPNKGKISIDGKKIKKGCFLSKDIGYIPQNPDTMFFADSVEEEIFYTSKKLNLEKVDDIWIEHFNLNSLLKNSPHTLSYGEKRRVSICASILHSPKIVLYDEPTVGLNRELKERILQLILHKKCSGVTQIVISHDIEFVNLIKSNIEMRELNL